MATGVWLTLDDVRAWLTGTSTLASTLYKEGDEGAASRRADAVDAAGRHGGELNTALGRGGKQGLA